MWESLLINNNTAIIIKELILKEDKIIYLTHLINLPSEIFMQRENLTHNLRKQEFKINSMFSKFSQEKIIFREHNQ